MTYRTRSFLHRFILVPGCILAMVASMAGCELFNLDVNNPSDIEDADLNNPDAIPAIVAGVHGLYAYALVSPGGGGLINAGAMLTDELVHSGTWVGLRGLSDGLSRDDWVESQSRWWAPHEARFAAEDGIRRINLMIDSPDIDVDVAQAEEALAELAMWAGHANRVMGEHFPQTVIDGGAPEPHTVFLQRAIDFFDDAEQRAQAAGLNDIRLSAIGGRAQANLMLGNMTAAVADAADIPTDFVFEQIHSDNSGRERNQMRWWGYLRDESTVWGTPFEEWGLNVSDENSEGDPRVVYDTPLNDEGEYLAGGDGRRPFFRQLKYPSYASNISVVKGTEMRLIEAEAALINEDIPGMMEKINEVRAHHELDDLPEPGTLDEAWQVLMRERGIELWLEARRLPDLRRWSEQGRTVPFEVVRGDQSGPAEDDPRENVVESAVDGFVIQISQDEKNSNEHFR